MEDAIIMKGVTKEFKVLNRHEGLKGSLKDLFSRDYKTVTAVDNISINIKPGEIVGYLGPNRTRNAENIGVVFGQRSQLWWSLPLIESFKLLKDIYMIDTADYNRMIELYRELADIETLLHKPVRQMSLGQRTLSDILAAFLHNPKIIFLDEPTIGLDVSMKAKIRELIKGLNKEKNTTVILTTHDMGDVDALCQRIVIIDHGRMIYDNDIEHLKHYFGSYRTLRLNLADSGWKEIIVDESKTDVMTVISEYQRKGGIKDISVEDISTEEVIKKIYENAASRSA